MKEKAAEETISHATFQVRQSMRTLGSGLKARSLLIASRQENVRACDKVLHAWANSIWRKCRLRLKHSLVHSLQSRSEQANPRANPSLKLASWAENWSESVWLMSSNHVSPFALMNWLEREALRHTKDLLCSVLAASTLYSWLSEWADRSEFPDTVNYPANSSTFNADFSDKFLLRIGTSTEKGTFSVLEFGGASNNPNTSVGAENVIVTKTNFRARQRRPSEQLSLSKCFLFFRGLSFVNNQKW